MTQKPQLQALIRRVQSIKAISFLTHEHIRLLDELLEMLSFEEIDETECRSLDKFLAESVRALEPLLREGPSR